jgi:hypothetical protein
MKKYLSSFNVLMLIILAVLVFTYKNGFPTIFTWDAFGQYIYLPMIFDKGQLVFSDLEYFKSINEQYDFSTTLYQFVTLDNGNFMTKYTMGLSVLLLPFYLLAEVWASFAAYTTDGFTYPYQVMTAIGSSFYFVIGMIYLRKLFRCFFEDYLTSVLLIILVFGTNVWFMQFASLGSTHNFEFALVSVMMYYTIKFHETASFKNGIILSLSIGLIALVRLPDLLFVLIPIFWKRQPNESFKDKLVDLFLRKKNLIIWMIVLVFSLLFLQLGYWKLNAGTWLMNSYANNAGEGFDWWNPYFVEILFSFRKGWLIYTPVLFFSLVGFYYLCKKNWNGKLLTLTFILFFFVVSSWTTWWYAGSYSCRALIDFYPILGISLGYFINEIKQKKGRYGFYFLFFVLTLLNLFQTYQIDNRILPKDRITKAYYFSVFGQTTPPSEEQKSLLLLDRDEIYEKKEIDYKKFHKTKTKVIRFPEKVLLSDSVIYAPKISFPWTKLADKKYFWLKVKWSYEGTKKELEGTIFNLCATYRDKAYGWSGFEITKSNLIVNEANQTVTFEYFTPHFRTRKDELIVGAWKQSGDPIIVKSVQIEVYEPYFENE